MQQQYGELIVAYYASGFADQSVFHFKTLYLYGGLFDVLAVGLQNILPLDAYAVRHLLSGLIGVGGICRRLGRRTRHWRCTRGALCRLGACDLRRLVWRDV